MARTAVRVVFVLALASALLARDVHAQSTVSFQTVDTTVNDANSTSIVIAVPSGTQLNDLLIATVTVDGNSPITPSAAGWTEINQGQCPNSGCTLGVWYRVATASEPASYTFTFANNKNVGAVLRYGNAHVESNVIDASGAATGTSATPTAPSVTTTVPNALVLRIEGNEDDTPNVGTYPGGTTGRFAIEGTGAGAVGSAGADATQASAGATGTAAFSTADATDDWRAAPCDAGWYASGSSARQIWVWRS